MKWMFSCKEITEICCDDDRALSLIDKFLFWMHLSICKGCSIYQKQIELLNTSMKKIISERSTIDKNKLSQLEKEIIEKVLDNSLSH